LNPIREVSTGRAVRHAPFRGVVRAAHHARRVSSHGSQHAACGTLRRRVRARVGLPVRNPKSSVESIEKRKIPRMMKLFAHTK
jgi:hypothetical protein